ncbi:MAG: aerotolerance regulator BatA [candidate division Zixibacteria bacterium RBG_16_40_9]|nr:MAG: aerotolerance regulator BatA [candidate division Zixibacteria bacterium RBG_16_40_9]
MFKFVSPQWLLLLVAVPIIIYFHFQKRTIRSSSLQYSDLTQLKKVKVSSWIKRRNILPILRILAIVFLSLALARPQMGRKSQEVSSEGIDIMLALDISGSMKAEDFKPYNRLYVAKEVLKQFVLDQKSNRVGLVIFAKESFTQCPLTSDYGVLLNFIDRIDFGLIEDGTAIGLGLANAINRLRYSIAKSKVIILLTDGINNAGEIDPLTAAQLAQAQNIKIYAIGAGKPGMALYPVDDPLGGKRYVYVPNELDEVTLKKIAEITNGQYFRAKDEKGLATIYKQISQMEKTKIKVKEYTQYNEFFPFWLALGLGGVLAEILLANTKFRKIP